VSRLAIRLPAVAALTILQIAAATLRPAALSAQVVIDDPCRPPESSNEAKLLAFYSVPMVFSPGGIVDRLPAGAIRLGFEMTYVPSPSASIQSPEACLNQKKTENTELSPIFPRPRITIGLPAGFAVEASYLPPVTVADATPNLGSVALSYLKSLRRTPAGASVDLMLRGHATFGQVKGPITCPSESLQQDDFAKACYGDTPSDDTFKPNMFGGEAALAFTRAGGRFSGYAGGGVTRNQPRFDVHFDYLDGAKDRRPIIVNLTRAAAFAGVRYRVGTRIDLATEVYSVPADVTTIRLAAGYLLR
jgi:hypothetical protein